MFPDPGLNLGTAWMSDRFAPESGHWADAMLNDR